MHTILRVYYTDLKNEVYLLDDWGASADGKVSKWVQTLTTKGSGNGKVNRLPICNFECDNLA